MDAICTDVVHFANQNLTYYRGNYNDFLGQKNQNDCFQIRQANTLARQRKAMMESIDVMKQQAGKEGAKGGGRSKQASQKEKKLARHGVTRDENGHHWSAQSQNCGYKVGSINAMGVGERKKESTATLVKQSGMSLYPKPDYSVQFKFRNSPAFTFYEPLIKIMDASFKFDGEEKMLFGMVDLCIMQKSRTVIVGPNGSGKTQLLKLLAGEIQPTEGNVSTCANVNVVHFSQLVADDMLTDCQEHDTPLSKMHELYPLGSDQDLRTALHCFGIGADQVNLRLKLMSGGKYYI